MTLPPFYVKQNHTDVLSSIEKERQERLERQKKLTSDERKSLFNQLSPEDKRLCLVDIQKELPLTLGDLEGRWCDKNGKILTDSEIKKIKDETAHYTTSARYYCWKSKGDLLTLRENDDKFRETGTVFSQVKERNDLAILVKGEKVLEKQGIVTFDAFFKSKKGP
jgi:hypothetical protein